MQWEYELLVIRAESPGFFDPGGRFNDNELYREMNRLGREGWELVTSFATNYAQGVTRDIALLFKRPRVPSALPADQ